MSMISEQITMLRDVAQAYNHNGVGMILKEAADTIEELSAKLASANMERTTAYYNDGWIPCSERLPEDKDTMCVDEDGIELIELIVQINGAEIPNIAHFVDGEFKHPFEAEGYGFADEVIAWRPLPTSYKPKGEN